MVIKANLTLDQIRLNMSFNFAIPPPFHQLFLQTPFGLGPVHTYPFSFEIATFPSRIRLSSTRIRGKRSPKTLSRVEFLKTSFSCSRVDGENRDFSKTMTYQYWIQPSRAKENGGKWSFHVLLCIKYPGYQRFFLAN